jgi:hypothetical protein
VKHRIKKNVVIEEVKRMAEKRARKRILAYSPKKRKVKGPLENSVLKPLTSSDSPSDKSKGVRLASMRMKISQRGRRIKKREWLLLNIFLPRANEAINIIQGIRIKEKMIS